MRTIQASEAKARFLRILDEVERGESITITRHGEEIAIISPRREPPHIRAKRAFANMDKLRKQTLPVSVEEILSARDEGRR
jgi:prevent-host-death family protein